MRSDRLCASWTVLFVTAIDVPEAGENTLTHTNTQTAAKIPVPIKVNNVLPNIFPKSF
mgnify:CR=1 FL=1